MTRVGKMTSRTDELKALLLKARQHPFYQDRVSALCSATQLDELLAAFPLTKKSDFRRVIPELRKSQDLRSPYWKNVYWCPSGGTTGGTPFFFPTDAGENVEQRGRLVPLLSRPGPLGIFRADDVMVSLFPGHGTYRALESLGALLEGSGTTHIALGFPENDAAIQEAVQFFRANGIAGAPPLLVQFALYVKDHGLDLRVPKLLFAGEAMQGAKRALMKDLLGAEEVLGLYGAAECGIWAYHPESLPPNDYIVSTDIAHVEIESADADGYGEIVFTNLCRKRFPVVRYATGDMGRVELREVSGSVATILELKGRESRSFSLAGDYFPLETFEDLLKDALAWQLVLGFSRDQAFDELLVRLVVPDAMSDDRRKQYAETVRAEILKLIPVGCHIQIDYIDWGSLERNPTSRKVMPVIDRRG